MYPVLGNHDTFPHALNVSFSRVSSMVTLANFYVIKSERTVRGQPSPGRLHHGQCEHRLSDLLSQYIELIYKLPNAVRNGRWSLDRLQRQYGFTTSFVFKALRPD